jgi:hypothetical protein
MQHTSRKETQERKQKGYSREQEAGSFKNGGAAGISTVLRRKGKKLLRGTSRIGAGC